MKILSVGSTSLHPKGQGYSISIQSTVSLLDYDVLVVDVQPWYAGLVQDVAKRLNKPQVHSTIHEEFAGHLRRWEAGVKQFLQEGRTVFVFPYVPFEYYVGSTNSVTRHIYELPRIGLSSSFTVSHGKNIERASKADNALWRLIERGAMYRAIIEQPRGDVLMMIAKTSKAIATCEEMDGGRLVYLPGFAPSRFVDPASTGDKDRMGVSLFFEAVVAMATRLTATVESESFVPPSWAAIMCTRAEVATQLELKDLAEQTAEINKRVTEINEFHQREAAMKALYCGQSDALLEAAKHAFEALGFTVGYGPEGRDDLILKDGDEVAVVEVKGRLNGSAKEADAAQLEKWVSGYYVTHGVEPKGVLIINAFAEQPLQSRSTDVFPHQMLGYVSRKQMCLISGIQLYCMANAEMDASDLSKIRKTILGTTGMLSIPNVPTWEKLLESKV